MLKLAIGVGLLLASSPLLAQQTTEGAQEFLRLQFERGITHRFSRGGEDRHDMTFFVSPGKPTTDQCITHYKFNISNDPKATDSYIEWRNVPAVVQVGASVNVQNSPKSAAQDPIYAFTKWEFGSPELAARAAFAMEFLRDACDPAASTGF